MPASGGLAAERSSPRAVEASSMAVMPPSTRIDAASWTAGASVTTPRNVDAADPIASINIGAAAPGEPTVLATALANVAAWGRPSTITPAES